jgi:class 3 adenylate cyclase/tetratricopeptide (TPR) repeat protein
VASSCPRCGTPNADDAAFCVQCGTRLAAGCPRCGASTPPGARFCPACGLPLAEGDAGSDRGDAPREERRIVTILFADLAGFTERSDRADPEDIRRTLRPFHAAAKEEIERFGGTLDKFIGDAVMGVFGAPVAHEDDAERGVRAALRLQVRVADLNREHPDLELSVRAAVNSGEAVVTFATGPQIGENVAGDVVNTASRLQAEAPVGGVLVGEPTYLATRATVSYRELDPVTVKGKAEPLRVWVAESAGAAAGDRPDERGSPFVGREDERHLLRELFARGVRAGSPQLVTITGDPGIGKTRLVADLRAFLDDAGDPVAWHRGRCLSYGEGVTFWALAEMVKEIAGIRETDDRSTATRRLAASVAAVEEDGIEHDWLRARLAPLVGVAEPGETVDRDESFAAWLRFLRGHATRTPTVLVFEDLHWAEPPMLDFVDRSAEGLAGTPTLVVATARPELFDRRPAWGGGRRNATTIALARFSDREMGELLDALLVRSPLVDEARGALARTAGGNPLYAREFVRMLADRGMSEHAAGPSMGTVPVPDTIQSLIASRLDALPGPHRALLQDASVVGETFWAGVLQSMGDAAGVRGTEEALAELERRGLIESVRPSAMEGQEEFRFTHALIRDVAYGQFPRAERARRHLAVAEWIERMAGDRVADRAELMAHHYLRTLELTRAAAAPGLDLEAIEDSARDALTRAAELASGMDVAQAGRLYRQALDLAPPGHPARPALQSSWVTAAWRAGELSVEDTFPLYEEAIAGFESAGDRVAAGATTRRLYYQLAVHGETARSKEVLDRALELLEGEPPSPALAEVYVSQADVEMFAGRTAESLAWAERALGLADVPGTETSLINALHIRGNARCELGDPRGLDDFREALDRSVALGDTVTIITTRSYLGEWSWLANGPGEGLAVLDPAIQLLRDRGLVPHEQWARAERLSLLFDLGRWDELTDEANDLLAWEARHGETQSGVAAMPHLARVHLHRGRVDEAADLVARMLPRAREIEDLQVLAPALVSAAVVADRGGRASEALALVEEFDRLTADAAEEYRGIHLPDLVRVCLGSGDDAERATRLVATTRGWTERYRLAVLTAEAAIESRRGGPEAAADRFAVAADGWERYGMVLERVLALRSLADSLRELGRSAEAEDRLAEAAAPAATLGLT